MNGKETLEFQGFLFFSKHIFDIRNTQFVTHEIAEQFTCPMTKFKQKFDDNCSMAYYLRNLIKDIDLITKCLKKSPRRWLIYGSAVRILFQYTIDIWDSQRESHSHAESSFNEQGTEIIDEGDSVEHVNAFAISPPLSIQILFKSHT